MNKSLYNWLLQDEIRSDAEYQEWLELEGYNEDEE